MPFTRGQTQLLYQFMPGTIFEHDQYGYCLVTDVELREIIVNQNALFDALANLLAQWEKEQFRRGFPDPRDLRARRLYSIGTPTVAHFKPYPTQLECRSCYRVYQLKNLKNNRQANPGHCPNCSGALGQLRHIQAHNCGRLEELYYPRCERHGTEFLTFRDTGRVETASWRCQLCGDRFLTNLRMTPCTCDFTKTLEAGDYNRFLRVFRIADRALHLSHILSFINFDERQEEELNQNPQAFPLMLARLWGLINTNVKTVLAARFRHGEGQTSEQNAMMAKMVEALAKTDPNNPLVQQYRTQQSEQTNPPGEEAIHRVEALLGTERFAELGSPAPRQLIEYIGIVDSLDVQNISDIAAVLEESEDKEGAQSLYEAERMAQEELGIQDLRVINDFPIALSAVGYSRVTRDPNRSVIMPFSAGESTSKIPLYVVASETEGIYVQLDPLRVAGWLIDNDFVVNAHPNTKDEAWAWLYRHVPGMVQIRWEDHYNDPAAVAVRTLVHTISHTLLKYIEWSGFNESSVGEYLLPGALAFVLYANRYAESKIGGLTTLFEQRLQIWLADACQSGRSCNYDPFCYDDGGSCVGCMHREFNCTLFNRELSRSVLYGGPTPDANIAALGSVRSIQKGYWQMVHTAVESDEVLTF